MVTLLKERVVKTKRNNYKNEYKCYCGNIFQAHSWDIKNGNTKSCGCYRKKNASLVATKHGLCKNNMQLVSVWSMMKQRCLNEKSAVYKNYGGRGIMVHSDWINFKSFYEWAIISGYSDGLQLDRVNNDGNYCPENCRWASRETNMQNRRCSVGAERVIIIRQKLKNGATGLDISKEYNISPSIVSEIKTRKIYKNIY